ncbi:MAG: ATP-dependent DNA helicase RecG [Alphaproteobacteria bacterium]|nr:ATP-dependent DNA helicase RecG [Alphaproteobacteria bacterium]
MASLSSLYKTLEHITKDKRDALERIGITTVRDLLYYVPKSITTHELSDTQSPKKEGTYSGVIKSIRMRRGMGAKRVMLTEAKIEIPQQTGRRTLTAIWFHQPYIAKQYESGMAVTLIGTVSDTNKGLYMTNPVIEENKTPVSFSSPNETLLCWYKETYGISSLFIRERIKKILLDQDIKETPDPIPEYIKKELHLPDWYDAMRGIHMPKTVDAYERAKKRFIFEEIYFLQLIQKKEKRERSLTKTFPISINKKHIDTFMNERFEFIPTQAQRTVITEIIADLNKQTPMARLLEGDVGSGKTAVAGAVIYAILTQVWEHSEYPRFQIAYLAPTEILARQQYETLLSLFNHLPISIALLTSKECLKYPSKVYAEVSANISKKKMLEWLKDGTINVVVGTHALVQKNVVFKHLALAIVDEQHRFGVAQRQKLLTEHKHIPHMLSMTATPIPRTLALTMFGDMDISILDEMPKGRKPVHTKVLTQKEIALAYEHIRKEITSGRQAYIICPRISEHTDEDTELKLRSVDEEAAYLKKSVFPDVVIGSLHSKLKKTDKDEVLEKFRAGKIHILVSTTVVEVGVNVPNATSIIILHSDRFGLSQLHQLRGRVIRSTHQPYCFAITDSQNELTQKRLSIFEKNHNGFDLAQEDFNMRGAGHYAGNVQSGLPDLAMEAMKNIKLVEYAQGYAEKTLSSPLPQATEKELQRRSVLMEE